MGYLWVTAILVLLGVIGWVVADKLIPAKVVDSYNREKSYPVQKWVKATSVVIPLIIFLAVTGFRTVHTVENGHIGIVKQFGSLVGTTGEGLVYTLPWQSLDAVSVQNEVRVYLMDDSGKGVGSAVSSDSQPVFLTAAVDYSLQRDKAVSLYRLTGGNFVDRKLDKAVPQITKEVTAGYKAVEFAKNREKIRLQIIERLNSELSGIGLTINTVSLTNVDFTDALKKAIEGTVEAEQNAKKAEAQVKIKQAEADQVVATARGIADANVIQARGEALANRLRQRSLTPLLVQQQAVEKLNPKATIVFCPSDTVCIPNGNVVPVETQK